MARLIAAYNDEELIDGCLKNDAKSQERLYAKYYGKMLVVCSRYTRNKEDAIENLNNGFLKIFLNLKSFEGKGSFEGWMRRIMVNTVLEQHRKTVTYKEVVRFPETFADQPFDATIIDQLYADDLIKLIASLPPSSRTVFNLFVIEGYTHKEIAKMLQISEGTSKWHVSYAKDKLKKKIEESTPLKELAYGRI